MKQLLFLILVICNITSVAQSGADKKQKVTLPYGEHGIALNIQRYVDTADSRVIQEQVGKARFKAIMQSRSENDLPACYKKGDNLAAFTMYKIASYTTFEYDEYGFNQQQTTYTIIEVPIEENKSLTGNCKMTSTFYIRIPDKYVSYVKN